MFRRKDERIAGGIQRRHIAHERKLRYMLRQSVMLYECVKVIVEMRLCRRLPCEYEMHIRFPLNDLGQSRGKHIVPLEQREARWVNEHKPLGRQSQSPPRF